MYVWLQFYHKRKLGDQVYRLLNACHLVISMLTTVKSNCEHGPIAWIKTLQNSAMFC